MIIPQCIYGNVNFDKFYGGSELFTYGFTIKIKMLDSVKTLPTAS